MTVHLGMPRLDELLNVTRTPKQPITYAPMIPGTPEHMVQTIARTLKHVALKHVVVRVESARVTPQQAPYMRLLAGASNHSEDVLTALRAGTEPPPLICACITLDLRSVLEVARDPAAARVLVMRAIVAYCGPGAVGVCPADADDGVLLYFCRGSDLLHNTLVSRQFAGVAEADVDQHAVVRAVANGLLKYVTLYGVRGIRSAHIDKHTSHQLHGDTGELVSVPSLSLVCIGSNMADMMRHPCVDWARVTCNHVHETLQVLGLEAACALLHREICTVLGGDGSSIDQRHVSLLVNSMTYMGYLMPANRFGIRPSRTVGPIATATFEEAVDVFCEAAASGSVDPIREVSTHILTGTRMHMGTGLCDTINQSACAPEEEPVVCSALADQMLRAHHIHASANEPTRFRPSSPSRAQDWPTWLLPAP